MDEGTEALRRLAPCWSLAGDDQLLNILQNTHQRIVTKCNEVNKDLEVMVSALDDASISLQNVNNNFMALSNKQFIESRVYDDDGDVTMETPPVKFPPKVITPESELESLKRSLLVLDRMHETITILQDSDTDTESEDEMTERTVLKPKDMYADRPLPYIIGSQQWKSKWHAGLLPEHSDTDSTTSKRSRSEQYSDSEPESLTHTNPETLRPPERTDRTISDTSSELPSEQDMSSLPKQKPSDIAAELARRLGGQLPQLPDPEPECEPPPVVKKTYKPPLPNSGPIFSDEPPPLHSSSEEDIFAELHKNQPYSTTRPVPDLFGEEEEIGEGDIFSDYAKPTSKVSANQKSPLFGNESEPEVFTEKTPAETPKETDIDSRGTKKPVGGISLFGTNKGAETIGAAILNRNRRKSSTSGDESGSERTEARDLEAETKREVKNEGETMEKDIFDDLFAKSAKTQKINTAKPKPTVVKNIQSEIKKKKEVETKKVDIFNDSIFDDIDDIFSTNTVKMPEKSKQKSIFDDDNDDDLFSEVIPKTKTEMKSNNDKNNSLFDSYDELFSENVNKPKTVEIKPETVKNKPKMVDIKPKTVETKPKSVEIKPKMVETKPQTVEIKPETVKIKPETDLKAASMNIIKPTKSILDDEEDLFSNVKRISSKSVENIDNSDTKKKIEGNLNTYVAKESKVFNSPSLFDDDDDNNLFNNPIKATSNLPQNVMTADNITSNEDMFRNNVTSISEPLNAEERKENSSVNMTDNPELVNEMSRDQIVLESEQSSIKNIKPTKDNKDVMPHYEEDGDDFEQDFDDLPPSIEEKNNVNIKINPGNNTVVNINVETDIIKDELKPSCIFDSDKDNFSKSKAPLAITVQTKSKEATIAVSKYLDTKSTSMKVDDDLSKENSEIPVQITPKSESIIKSVQTPDTDLSDNLFFAENESDTDITQIVTKVSDEPPNSTESDKSQSSNDDFEDLFIEPPAFEKPKQPKRSKNINALFDDDSEDEALFFKKNDPITDEREDFKTDQDKLFGLFRDEPPDVDLKDDNDEPRFSSQTAVIVNEPATSENNSKINTNLQESTTPKASQSNIFDSDDELFGSVAKSSIQRPDLNKDVLKSVISKDLDNLSDEENLFKTISKKEDKLPQSNTENLNKNISDEENLFKPKSGIKTVISELLKDDKVGQLDDDWLKPKSEIKPENSNTDKAKTQAKSDSNTAALSPKSCDDEDLSKTLPKNMSSEFHNRPSKSKESGTSKPETTNEESPKKVGKLKTIGLNINVNALLPGSSPKKQIPTEQTSPKQSKDTIDNKQIEKVKTVNFNDEPESGVLDNKLSKERAKIQVKRRPSTRRARKEAARKSGIDFGDDSTDNSSSIDDPPRQNEIPIKKSTLTTHDVTDKDINAKEQIKTVPNEVIESKVQVNTNLETNKDKPHGRDIKSKIVYVLNDEDIFNTPNASTLQETSKNTQSDIETGINTIGQVYKDKKSMFDDKNESQKKGKSIFDSDSDEELFMGASKKNKVKKLEKTSLFSDDDDDDLFGAKKKSSNEPKPRTSQSTTAKEVSKSTEMFFDDPLSMLGDDD